MIRSQRLQVPRIVAAILAVLLVAGLSPVHAGTSKAELALPNIILIMTDDQGYGDIGRHDNPVIATPHLDRLHDESISLTQFHVDPTCSPTRAALMTGKHSLRAGVWHTIMGRSLLGPEHVTLAERLRDAGYRTAIFGKWHLGDNAPYRPQDQGFEHSVIHGGGGVGQTPDYWGNTQFGDTYWRDGALVRYAGNATDVWFDEAERFITQTDDRPFFAYIATNAPHMPWRVADRYADPYRQKGLPEAMARFYGMITHIDERMGQLLDLLEARDLARNTILIFMGDNGSSFYPVERLLGGEPERVLEAIRSADPAYEDWVFNAGLRGYKNSVFDGGHKVPFLIRWPGGDLSGPQRIDAVLAHYDVLPTLMELVDLEGSEGDTDLDGSSFAGLLRGDAHSETFADRAVVITNQRVFDPVKTRPAVVLLDRWRYVLGEGGDEPQLYDIVEDPSQTRDISKRHPEIAARLQAIYDQWWSDVTAGAFPVRRIPVGSAETQGVRLTAMDWMEAPSTEAVPWFPGFQPPKPDIPYTHWLGREESFEPLPWYLDVEEAGIYRIRLYLHDVPAARPVGHPWATLRLHDVIHSAPVHGRAAGAEFDVTLDRGPVSLTGWFAGTQSGPPAVSAFYAYIERVPDER